jgi:hypothetical protein
MEEGGCKKVGWGCREVGETGEEVYGGRSIQEGRLGM